MKRRHERLHTTGNMIVFPGTVERLLAQAEDAMHIEEYEEAVRLCEQLLEIAPHIPETPGILAVALYETKEFERAKPYAAEWLQSGLNDYFEAMELYLAICIQLQDYNEVEDVISALLEEGVVPGELQQKFVYLRELNSRLAKRFTDDLEPIREEIVSFEDFLEMDFNGQQEILSHLEHTDAQEALPLLRKIAEYDALPSIQRTVALVLLRKQKDEHPLVIRKFGRGIRAVPAELPLPGEDPATMEVFSHLQQVFDKDPSRYSLMEESVRKFAVISYPLGWGAPADAVAQAYEEYSAYLFEGTPLPSTALHRLILEVDEYSSEEAD